MKKFWLYFHTIRYLKPNQVFYLLWYKFKKLFPLKESYGKYKNATIKRLQYDDYTLIVAQGKFRGNNRFVFLNVEHQFSSTIDWNIHQHGKLWNYNLQYFDFIFDEQFSTEEFIPMIEDCSASILHHQLALEPYPVSLRLVNWLLFHSKTGFISSNFEKAIKFQTAYLEKNLEVQLLGNHYFENLVTLFVVALYLGNEKLLQKSSKKFKEQLKEQILDDGGHYECSPMYHVILLSRLLLVYRLIQINQLEIEIKKPLANAIEKMQGWLNAFCFENGSYALFNDASNNIAVETKTIKTIFQKTGLSASNILFKESGYRKFSNRNFEAIIDVGNIIPPFQPGHAHSDMLSFCLNFQDKEVFIDPGVSTYEVNEQRLMERGTAIHNTVSINNENQSEVWASFRMAKRAKIIIDIDVANHCKANHDGYYSRYGIIVSREFRLKENRLLITDEVIGNKQQIATTHFFLHPSIIVSKINENTIDLHCGLKMLFSFVASLEIKTISIPDGYNKFIITQMVEVVFHEKLYTVIIAEQ